MSELPKYDPTKNYKPGELVEHDPKDGVPTFPVQAQVPTVGRIVLFYDKITKQTSPAIVTMADPNGLDSTVNLSVLPDLGMPFSYAQVPNVSQSGGSQVFWVWPPRFGVYKPDQMELAL